MQQILADVDRWRCGDGQPAVNSAHLQAQSRVIAHGFRKAANCGVPTGRQFPAATARTWAQAAPPLYSSDCRQAPDTNTEGTCLLTA